MQSQCDRLNTPSSQVCCGDRSFVDVSYDRAVVVVKGDRYF
ncbi:hypothetical protein [Nostoc sp.]